MKNILEKFEKIAAAHQLNEDAAAAMRGLLQDAHTAGYEQHMDIASSREVQPVMVRSAEPNDDDEPDENAAVPSYAGYAALHMAMHKMVKKTIRKELRKGLNKVARAKKKAARKVIRAAAARSSDAAALVQ